MGQIGYGKQGFCWLVQRNPLFLSDVRFSQQETHIMEINKIIGIS